MPTKVYVFGSGDCGQLGLGEDVDSRKKPTSIPYFEDKNIVDICAGGLHTLALGQDGKVYSWGCNDEKALGRVGKEFEVGQVDSLNHEFIVQIAAGDSISAALTKEGKVYTWGTFRDSKGVLGFSTNSMMQEVPTLLEGMKKEKVEHISAGANHMIAITGDNMLFTWGCGEQGQLGRRILERHKTHGLSPQNITPRKSRKGQNRFDKVACGSYHSLAITKDHQVYSWGLNNHGQLAQGDCNERVLPELIEFEENFIQVSGGEHHSLALTANGAVYAAGRGDSGQLGKENLPNSLILTKIDKLDGIVLISAGGNHNLALDKNGEIYSWGFGGMLQLGNGEDEDVFIPQKIKFSGKVKRIQAGGQHSVILAE